MKEIHLYNDWVISDIICVKNTKGKILDYGAILISNTMKMYITSGQGLNYFIRNPSLFSCYDKNDIVLSRDKNSNAITHVRVASTVIPVTIINVNWKSEPTNSNRLVKKAYLEYKGWNTYDIGTLTPNQMFSRIK